MQNLEEEIEGQGKNVWQTLNEVEVLLVIQIPLNVASFYSNVNHSLPYN